MYTFLTRYTLFINLFCYYVNYSIRTPGAENIQANTYYFTYTLFID